MQGEKIFGKQKVTCLEGKVHTQQACIHTIKTASISTNTRVLSLKNSVRSTLAWERHKALALAPG